MFSNEWLKLIKFGRLCFPVASLTSMGWQIESAFLLAFKLPRLYLKLFEITFSLISLRAILKFQQTFAFVLETFEKAFLSINKLNGIS